MVLSFIITDQRSEHEFEAGVSVRQIERRQTEEHALRRAGRQRDRVDRDRQLAERELAAVGQHRVRRLRVVGWPRVRRRVAPEQRDDVDAVHHEVLHVTDEGHAVAVVAGRHLQLVDVECVSFARYIRYAYTRLLLIIISIIVVIIVIVIVIIVIIIVVIIIIARSQYDHYTSCVRHRSDYTRFPLRSTRFKLRFSNYVCRRKPAVVLRQVAEGLRFECSQYGSFTVFAVYFRFPGVEPHKCEMRSSGPGFGSHRSCCQDRHSKSRLRTCTSVPRGISGQRTTVL